jgi:biotin carboxylase
MPGDTRAAAGTMPRILIVTATTGYQARAFEEAARRLGVDLAYATDRCTRLDDPWRDRAVAVRFDEPSVSAAAVAAAVREAPVDGVLAVGDGAALVAAHVADRLGLPFHPPHGVQNAISKLRTRGMLTAAGLPVPWFVSLPLGRPVASVADRVRFPCVVKPLALSASRGVMRADTPAELEARIARLTAILLSPELRRTRDPAHDEILVEGFIEGREYALEGVLDHGLLRVFAIFDKPDPLDGPCFEETIYVTPAALAKPQQRVVAGAIAHAAAALGLRHGPVHAECRVNEYGVFVLEVAPRPIGGLCARALRFAGRGEVALPLELLLLRHALGRPLDGYGREAEASAVMMMPIPRRGRYRGVSGIDEARRVRNVDDVVVTARPGQLLEPPPEGHAYLGFVFARAEHPEAAVAAVREAHGRLRVELDPSPPLA